jgi:regulator of protease activity HflC (stomatin/prohibitin superfamily)
MIGIILAGLFSTGFFIFLGIVLLFGLKIVKEYEKGIKFTLGNYSGMMDPGLRLVIPILQSWERIDLRTKVVDVPQQDCITKDNVTVNVNAVIYYKVASAENAILEVENYMYAVSQLAQTTMRDVVGEASLDQLLSQRDSVSKRIQTLVDKDTDPWGIKVDSVELKHIELPEEMKRVMAKQAEAEREKRATIIKAHGEVTAATNMAKAAMQLASTPGALHLRTLHSINDLSSDRSNTLIYAVPSEILRLAQRLGK